MLQNVNVVVSKTSIFGPASEETDYKISGQNYTCLNPAPLTWRIWWASNNTSRWQMGFNLAFKGLMSGIIFTYVLLGEGVVAVFL